MKACLILPHQLFELHPCLHNKDALVILAEDPLFFGDLKYPALFHKQKLVLHRATLKFYETHLKKKGYRTLYLNAAELKEGSTSYEVQFKKNQISQLLLADPVDFIAERRIRNTAEKLSLSLEIFETPSFLSQSQWITDYLSLHEHYAFTPFYIEQRKRMGILLQPNGKPLQGKWSFDTENRKKAPKGMLFPSLPKIKPSAFVLEAISYVEENYGTNPGSLDQFAYPTTHQEAKEWLMAFIHDRLNQFGPYEDAILHQELSLMHSVLTPALNIGLLTPSQVVHAVLEFSSKSSIPINSLEGFIRQVIGWREFIRGVYCVASVTQRTTNFWKHEQQIPPAFYTGSTGILPVDATIHKIIKHGYCHHIERLMVLGSFMLLCEFDPNAVYRWFMEMFIDAYDWVMVPNVYGMSQYADGGLMITKPYICGSNYIRKMSDYPSGDWCKIWDSLFWRFLKKHRIFFSKQPRLHFLCSQIDKMGPQKIAEHELNAEVFLKKIHQ